MLSALSWVLPLLVCPACGAPLDYAADGPDSGLLRHTGGPCHETYPVIDGVPRLLRGAHRATLLQRHHEWFERLPSHVWLAEQWHGRSVADEVASGFDYEWSRFRTVGTDELGAMFDQYFDLVPARSFAPEFLVLDAGCGAGRWSVEVAVRGPRVVAVDLGLSIDIARSNCDPERVACVQADLLDVAFAPGSFDWAYSLGVLHHTLDPNAALRRLSAALRPEGSLLLYLYYALDNRGQAFRSLFRVVDAIRRATSRLPRRAALGVSLVAAVFLYWPLARLARAFAAVGATGLAERLPLSAYRDRSLKMMWNDSLDRFGTTVEKRFTRDQMTAMLTAAGFDRLRFSDRVPYWHVIARLADQPASAAPPPS